MVGVRLEPMLSTVFGKPACTGRYHRNDGRAALNAEAFVVAVDGVRNQLIERSAGLDIEVSADQKLPRCPVAAVELELMRTIIRQTSVGVIEQALKIEQRSDVRIRLAVIVTEQAFVVADQARVNVRSDELIVVRKSLRGSELDCAVETLGAAEAARQRPVAGSPAQACAFVVPGSLRPGLKMK